MTGARKRILVVDDDYDFLESMQLVLLSEGHDVFTAEGGGSAVAKYAELRPDLVFLDVKMPGIDGYETLLRIRKHDRDARIVFTSGYLLDDSKYRKAKEGLLAGLVNKPIGPGVLKKMIKMHAK